MASREPFDEYLGAQLAADQREMLAEEAMADHRRGDHVDTPSEHCPICYEESAMEAEG